MDIRTTYAPKPGHPIAQSGFSSFEILLAGDMEEHEYERGEFVTLRLRGDVWRVEKVLIGQGYSGDDMLVLTWIAGSKDPGREVEFGSNTARLLNAMEVVALCAK